MNTHQKYGTVEHHHFDFMTADGYPSSALTVVGCADGRWYLEQDFGDEYSRFPGIVKSAHDTDTQPAFYDNLETAARAAFALIQQIYPSTPKSHLLEFLDD